MSKSKMDGAESGWTIANLLKLVDRIRSNIPESEKTTRCEIGVLSVNWDKTAFPPYSAKECHDQWQKVMEKMRIFRSLSEVIAEAEEAISKPPLHKKKDKKKHARGRVERKRKSDNLCKDNNLPSPRKSKRARLSAVVDADLPTKPPRNGLFLFMKESAAENRPSLGSDLHNDMRKRWRELNEPEKDEYCSRCLKMKHEYNAKLKESLDRLDETEKQQTIKEQGIGFVKAKPLRTSPREPKMPSQTVLTYFAKDQKMSSAKSMKLWDKLPAKEKERYKEQMHSNMKQYSENLQKWFKNLTTEEQTEYLKQNPSKLQFLDPKQKQVHNREELHPSQPSDSEDEDITDNSSEDDIWISYEDESGEDWDMFEMHR
ncbi:upstream-binding factor 1-like protein 1 isoform X2 [Poecilia formosa]|uniref:upstream-binding factor 1-like protein 1 isoform X2 n=1 Tax=Poecilia formosa TaxID=48698 RepID=UPI0007BA551A|nr:PREDICTED: upstream-binding factor 1-like protein 1 isoform X2 [Poecilia formosa]